MTGDDAFNSRLHLRLIWPQWQGAGSATVHELFADQPLDGARRGYVVGTKVLQAIIPNHDGPTAEVPVSMSDEGLPEHNGIEAKEAVLRQQEAALRIITEYRPRRITTLGGDCAVSIAPFSALAQTYGDDFAVIWIDSHPDIDTDKTEYQGFHAMAVSALMGHGDLEVVSQLPATVPASRIALVGIHDWTSAAHEQTAKEWGLSVFSPEALRQDSTSLLEWLRKTGASKVAIHFDVDTIDADEVQLGLGYDRGGLTTEQAHRVVADVEGQAEVVAFSDSWRGCRSCNSTVLRPLEELHRFLKDQDRRARTSG